MTTEREKKLVILLLKERIERKTGKKVILKENLIDPENKGQVAEKIRRILGVTQEELAKIAGVSISTVSRASKDFERRNKENQNKIVSALYRRAGYNMPTKIESDIEEEL